MKNTLWTFGDSMTFGHGCSDECHSHTKEEYLAYKKEGDDIWPKHLSKFLDYNLKNLGRNGASNDYILDCIIDNFDNIKENDVVVINKTIHGRIEVPYKDKTYRIPASYEQTKVDLVENNSFIHKVWITEEFKDFGEERIEAFINFQYHFSDHVFYKNRNNKRFDFLKGRLVNEKKVKFCFVWGLEESIDILRTFANIKQDTNGKIDDTHFSFKGHLDFARYLYAMIDNQKRLI